MRHFLPFFSALLLWLAHPPADLGWLLAWVALIPLVVWSVTERKGWRAFLIAWAAGCVHYTAAFSWLTYTAPYFGPVGVGLYMGLYWGLFAVVLRWACSPERPLRMPLALSVAMLWVVLELARATVLGGLPFFILGYSIHRLSILIQCADIGGVWLITFIIAFINGTLAQTLLEKTTAYAHTNLFRRCGAIGLCLLLAYGYGRLRFLPLEPGMKIGLVQPNIVQDLKEIGKQGDPRLRQEIYLRHKDLTDQIASQKPDLLVWPEAALLDELWIEDGEWIEDAHYLKAQAPAREHSIPLVIGVLIIEAPKGAMSNDDLTFTNSALYFDAEGKRLGRFDKIKLVPFSEYMLFGDILPVGRIVAHMLEVSKIYEFRRGREYPVFDHPHGRFSVSICSENYYPEITRAFARRGARTVINISNDGWFRESPELDAQMIMARFRAIESRVLYVRATNTGISALVAPTGAVIDSIVNPNGQSKSVEGTLVAEGVVTSSGSLYRFLGDWVAWLCLALLAMGVTILRVKRH